MLNVENISYSIGDRQLLRDIEFSISSDEKVGLVGVNGSGKSTLIKILMNELSPDSGVIKVTDRIGYVPQAITLYGLENNKTMYDYIASGRDLDSLLIRLNQLTEEMSINYSDEIINQFSEISALFEAKGGWDAESSILKILVGLGLDFIELDRPMGKLSGGQKTRVALARVIFANPDLLILDEPTNHLDLNAKLWLMNYLSTFHVAVLIVSHDLEMLDKSVNKILYLNEFNNTITTFSGNYSSFKNQLNEINERITKTIKNHQSEIVRLKDAAIRNLGGGPKKASQGHAIMKRVERLEKNLPEPPKISKTIHVNFSISKLSGEQVFEITNISKSYEKTLAVKSISFNIKRGDRWAIIGINGAGKSTLLKILMGKLSPSFGSYKIGSSVDIGYYSQDHEELNLNNTLIQECQTVSKQPEGFLRSALAHFLFQKEKVFEKVSVLSGGERSRLSLCKLVLHGHNTLLMDEPTNNLDPLSVDKLLQALIPYEGTMLIVSHDLSFLQDLRPHMAILMPEAKIVPFDEKIFDRVNKWE